jgi:SAM-dependent methyltransferase
MQHASCPVHPEATLRPAVRRGADYAWGFDGEFEYGDCPECKTLVLDPRPDPDELGQYYSRYYTDAMRSAYTDPYKTKKPETAGFLDRAQAIGAVKAQAATGYPFAAEQRVLDVGCGLGGFARFLRDLSGVEVRGVDFDPSCKETAARIHNVDVDTGDLRTQKYPDGSFDVVTSHHCLEHVYDPLAELLEMERITKPGGWVHIDVPTAGVLASVFGGRWAFLQPPTHFYHFHPKAIETLVAKAGFTELRVRRPWLPGELAFSLLQACGVKGSIPTMVLPATSLRERLIKVAFAAALAVDVPITPSWLRWGSAALSAFSRGNLLADLSACGDAESRGGHRVPAWTWRRRESPRVVARGYDRRSARTRRPRSPRRRGVSVRRLARPGRRRRLGPRACGRLARAPHPISLAGARLPRGARATAPRELHGTCSACGGQQRQSFGERVHVARSTWYLSTFCEGCRAASEADGPDRLPDDLRAIELARNGRWSVFVDRAPPTHGWSSIRAALDLDLGAVSALKERLPCVVFEGTFAEALRVREVFVGHGASASLREVVAEARGTRRVGGLAASLSLRRGRLIVP